MIVYLTTVIKGILLTLLWFLKIYFLTSHECCLKNMLMIAMICWFLLCYFINWKNFSVMSFKFLRKSKTGWSKVQSRQNQFLPWLITISSLNLSFRYPAEYLKPSAEDLDIRLTVWVWICRLVLKSSAEVLRIRYPVEGFIKSGP